MGNRKGYRGSPISEGLSRQNLISRIVYIGLTEAGAVFHLNSPDYDEYLKERWVCFKGMENALAKSKLYKQSLVGEASDKRLRTIVENDLIAKRIVMEMLPRDLWGEQSPDTETVLLVLRGLIRRYTQFQQRRAQVRVTTV